MTIGSLVLIISVSAFGMAALVAFVAVPNRLPRDLRETLSWSLDVLGSVTAVVSGAAAVRGYDVTVNLGDLGTGLGTASLHLDRLSGLFVVITFGVATAGCLANLHSIHPIHPQARPRVAATIAFALLSVWVILAAGHLFTLLFGWEGLTVAFTLLAGLDRRQTTAARASVLAGTFGKLSGAFLLAGGALVATSSGSLSFAVWSDAGPAPAPMALLLIGFAIKVGAVPVQVWLPTTYASAPAPARAVMAGAAVNVGFYGMWRTLQVLGPAPAWLAVVVLVIGGVTAVLGIAHAAVHPDLRGLIAWSSVENAGVITAGFGVALAGSATGDQLLLTAGLLAATAQVIAHALAKSLLFVSAAQIEAVRGSMDLEDTRGVAHELPWTAVGIVVGGLTLAGLPLTAGFASEWLTLESLMQQFRITDLPVQLASATAAALVALSIGIASVTFVRLVALTAFSAPPAAHRDRRHEPWPHRAAVIVLTLGCLGAAAAAPWEIDVISAGLRPLAGSSTDLAHRSPFALQPVYSGFSSLSPSWLWLVLPLLTAATVAMAALFSGSRLWHIRRVPAWSSASPGVERGVGYTSFAYANPMRKVLSNILLSRGQLQEVKQVERVQAARLAGASGPAGDGPGAPGKRATSDAERAYEVDVVEVVEQFLYLPANRLIHFVARRVTRLQSGRLDAYMAYMLIALLGAIALVAALS